MALIRYANDWLAPHQDNVTEWDVRLLYWWLDRPVRQLYKVCALTQGGTHPTKPLMLLGRKFPINNN